MWLTFFKLFKNSKQFVLNMHLHCLIYDINVILLQVVLIIIFLFCLLQSEIIYVTAQVLWILILIAVGIIAQVQYLFYNNKDLWNICKWNVCAWSAFYIFCTMSIGSPGEGGKDLNVMWCYDISYHTHASTNIKMRKCSVDRQVNWRHWPRNAISLPKSD